MAIVIPLKATDDDLIRIGKQNPGYQVEREEDGTVTMSPTHTKTSSKVVEAGAQLRDYAKRVGGKAFGSNAGFAIGLAPFLPYRPHRADTNGHNL